MKKTALFAAALAAALYGVASPKASAQTLGSQKSTTFVTQVLLASSETGKSSQVKSAEVEVANETKQATPAASAPVIVTVQPGDSLSGIAEANGTTWVRLYNANESITNPNVINPGDQVRIPAADEVLADRPLPQPVVAAPAATTRVASPRVATPATSYPVSANAAKAFIYAHESGNNPNATNPSGCYGLGQDCNGVLRTSCGADYACQDAYFDGYAIRRYGSWEGAYAFWLSHHWW